MFPIIKTKLLIISLKVTTHQTASLCLMHETKLIYSMTFIRRSPTDTHKEMVNYRLNRSRPIKMFLLQRIIKWGLEKVDEFKDACRRGHI